MQVPVAVIFGWMIDVLKNVIVFDGTKLLYQILALTFSVLYTALGMVCMIEMDFVQNPPDGLVKLISGKSGAELGKVKIIYDIAAGGLAGIIGMVCLGELRGLGAATIVSAVFVGRTVSWIRCRIRCK